MYPPVPEPLEVGTYDNHCHLEFKYDDDKPQMPWDENLDKAQSAGIIGVVQVGVTLESSKWSAELATKDSRVLAAVALHPNEAPLYDNKSALDAAIVEIAELAAQPRVRAIGETGLDFSEPRATIQLLCKCTPLKNTFALPKKTILL